MSTVATIRAVATAHPSFRMTRAEWLAIADRIAPADVDRALLARLAERSGIESRHCAAFEDGRAPLYAPGEVPGTAARMSLWSRAARSMSVDACRDALRTARVEPGAVTHLVTASCTGFDAPGLDAHLIESLGMRCDIRRTNIGFMGCHAAINALSVARSTVLADPRAVVLMCTAEVSSAHFHHTTRIDQLIANTLFADGAAAAVIDAGAGEGLTIQSTHSTLIPGSTDDMRWCVGDHGFEMTLGARVPEILETTVGAWVRGALDGHGLSPETVASWAIHPGGPRVIDAVCSALALPPSAGDPSRAVLREHGNMSSATLLFIVERLVRAGARAPIVGLAFGPGLVGEMVLLGEHR